MMSNTLLKCLLQCYPDNSYLIQLSVTLILLRQLDALPCP